MQERHKCKQETLITLLTNLTPNGVRPNLSLIVIILVSKRKEVIKVTEIIQTTIRMPKSLYKCLKKKAMERGQTVNGLIIGILWEQLKE